MNDFFEAIGVLASIVAGATVLVFSVVSFFDGRKATAAIETLQGQVRDMGRDLADARVAIDNHAHHLELSEKFRHGMEKAHHELFERVDRIGEAAERFQDRVVGLELMAKVGEAQIKAIQERVYPSAVKDPSA